MHFDLEDVAIVVRLETLQGNWLKCLVGPFKYCPSVFGEKDTSEGVEAQQECIFLDTEGPFPIPAITNGGISGKWCWVLGPSSLMLSILIQSDLRKPEIR